MTTISLRPKILYGLTTDVASNIHYLSDAEILYPVGNVIAIHNIPHCRQRFIKLPDKLKMNIICVAPNKKYVAICEEGEKPTIAIYDIQTLKRKKVLGIPYDASGVTKFSCIDFSFDNKYLAAVTGPPNQTMLYYNWEKGKVESSLKVACTQNRFAIVHILVCNPFDNSIVAIGGLYNFKFLTCTDTVWRPYGFSKADNISACSMTWLDGDRLLIGTMDGNIFYLEYGDLKNMYKMSDTTFMNLKSKDEYVMPATSSLTSEHVSWEKNIRCLISFQKGFAFAFGVKTIVVFERDGQHKYVKRNVYTIPSQVHKYDHSDFYKVNALSINLSADRLAVTTKWSQIFYAKLWGLDLNVDPEPQELHVMVQQLHPGCISGLATCAWKSIFMTSGELDYSVRLWDFESGNMILLKQYSEDICGIALHPNGLFCLIGFNDKLRFMTILIDDLLPMQEFPIRCCSIVKFSYGGHLFAAVNGNIVQVYSSIDFANRFVLKGHTNRIKTLLWSLTDNKLMTLGVEGVIYQWDMVTGKRSIEIILKKSILHDILFFSDEKTGYGIGRNGMIYELNDKEVVRKYTIPDMTMQRMVLGKDDQSLFLVSTTGVILSVQCPIQEPVQYASFHIHAANVTEITLSYNEHYLVSTDMDNTLCIWEVYRDERKGAAIKELPYTNEVLISKNELKEKIKTIQGLTVRIREMETEHSYKMREITVLHDDKVRDIYQAYNEAITNLTEKISNMQKDHKTELNTINVEIVKIKDEHEATMKQVEMNYDAKLITEYDKYLALENAMNAMRLDYEKRLEELKNHDAEQLQNTTNKYEALLYEQKLQLEQIQDEMAHQAKVHEQMTSQIEDDVDKELLDIRTGYESKLHEERETNIRLKGEAGMMQNRYTASQKEVADLTRHVQRVQSQYNHFQATIQELEKDKEVLTKEIAERDSTIQNRENQIYELNRSKQELEKFKFVLNYKITELNNQIEPRDQEIKELKEKIRDVETELVNLHKTNVSLELQLLELREKLGSSRRELQHESHRNKRCRQLLEQIRVDLHDVSELVQEPQALKAAITKLYHKYSSSDEFLRSRKADLDAQCEFIKQRDHLERTIVSLKKQVFQDTTSGGKNLDKTVEENVTLITELNALRTELKEARKHVQHMEGLLGLNAKTIKPSEAKQKLDTACYDHEKLEVLYKEQMLESQSIINALKDAMHDLISKLPCRESKDNATF